MGDGVSGKLLAHVQSGTIVDLLMLSTGDFIVAAYQLILGRDPDSFEHGIQSAALRSGIGRRKMLFEIYNSREHMRVNAERIRDSSDAEFIEFLYGRYLKRDPDDSGMDYYGAMLDRRVPRNRVLRNIATSAEALGVGSLWTELERLVAAERRARRRRWLWVLGRDDRLLNQQHEVLLNRNQGLSSVFESFEERLLARLPQAMMTSQGDAAAPAGEHRVAPPALAQAPTDDLSSEARRIVLRLRRASGVLVLVGTA